MRAGPARPDLCLFIFTFNQRSHYDRDRNVAEIWSHRDYICQRAKRRVTRMRSRIYKRPSRVALTLKRPARARLFITRWFGDVSSGMGGRLYSTTPFCFSSTATSTSNLLLPHSEPSTGFLSPWPLIAATWSVQSPPRLGT